MLDLRYVVLGTGRCGTVHMARLLTSLGLPCSHEGVFMNDGWDPAFKRILSQSYVTSEASRRDVVTGRDHGDWLQGSIVAESSYMAVPFASRLKTIFPAMKFVHVVRDPIAVASSFFHEATMFNEKPESFSKYRAFVENSLPELAGHEAHLDKICFYILEWNDKIDRIQPSRTVYRHCVEDGPTEGLLRFLNVRQLPEKCFRGQKINSWIKHERKPIQIKDIQNVDLRDRFASYVDDYRKASV